MNIENKTWIDNCNTIDWNTLSNLYKIAPLGDKSPDKLKLVFNNSMLKYFVYDGEVLVGAGRALADGFDCSYICDVAIHPDYQGLGLGKAIIEKLVDDSKEHQKILLYAVPTKEPFYAKFGFSRMKTAMAILNGKSGLGRKVWWNRMYILKKTKHEELLYLKVLSTQKHIGKNLNPKSLKKFQEEFVQKEITFLNIFSNTNEIAGYIILKVTEASVQLKRIVINEKYLGIGTEVMKELEVYVLEHYGVHEIWLDVYADNRRAIGLYEKLGYVRYNVGMENHREVWFYRKYFKDIN